MQKLISLNGFFLGVSFFVVQPVCAADNGIDLGLPDLTATPDLIRTKMNLPDLTATPSRTEMNQFRTLLLEGSTLDQLNGLNDLSVQFLGATDEASESALLGNLFKAKKEKLKAQMGLKNAMKGWTEEKQKLDELNLRVQELEQENEDLKVQADASDAKSAQEMLQKYKIALGCAGAFIVIDKLIIPLGRKACTVLKKMQKGQKRPNAWALLRSRFKREKSNA